MKVNSVPKSIEQYIKEIEVQAKKPLTEQINDLKVYGATLLTKLDDVIHSLDDGFDSDRVTCSIDDVQVDCDKLGEEDVVVDQEHF